MRMERNVHSALLVAMESHEYISVGQSKTIDLYNDSVSDVKLSKWLWGGFLLLKAEANWRHIRYARISLCGNDISQDEPIALYLSDNERYLSLSGATLLKGTCYLPKLGIRRAYIEGMSFSGAQLVEGVQKQSKPELPLLNNIVLSAIANCLHGNSLPDDSLVNIAQLMNRDSVVNSFYQKTLVFYSDRWITLAGKFLKGNIKVISKRGISVEKTATLNDILLFAPKIEIGSNLNGNVQIFATDTIRIGDDVTFLFPSIIALLDNDCKKPLIQLGKNCRILGDIILQSTSSKQKAECLVGENTEIDGKVYCTGTVELKGKLYGSLYCNGFTLRTASSMYENNLLNATIDFPALSKYYAGSLLYSDSPHLKQVKWEY